MLKLKALSTGLSAMLVLGLASAPLGAAAQTMAANTYEVTITNLTAKQVLSPPIIATHASSAHAWKVGQPASEGLKIVAEDGDNKMLRQELTGVATDIQEATAPVMPGQSVTLRIQAKEGDVLSAATMLVQTNDGFTGLSSMALTGGSSDEQTMAYDAGTEENTEAAAHVPGPPFGAHFAGTPTNPRQPISMHQGIKGIADVGAEFNWTGAVARFSVKMVGGGAMSPTGGTTGTGQAGGGTGEMPGMPNTGAGDDGMWLWVAAAALGLLGSGAVLSRRAALSR